MHVWSKIIGGGSAIVIPPSNDRNYIFEPVVFHNVQQKISKSHVQRGPIAVVLCDTRDTAASVGNYFITFNAGLTAQVRVNSLTNAHEMEEEEVGQRGQAKERPQVQLNLVFLLADLQHHQLRHSHRHIVLDARAIVHQDKRVWTLFRADSGRSKCAQHGNH